MEVTSDTNPRRNLRGAPKMLAVQIPIKSPRRPGIADGTSIGRNLCGFEGQQYNQELIEVLEKFPSSAVFSERAEFKVVVNKIKYL